MMSLFFQTLSKLTSLKCASPWNCWTIKGGNTTRSRRHYARDDPQSHGQLPWTASRVCHQ